MSRSQLLRDLGKLGPCEACMLIDAMMATAPQKTQALDKRLCYKQTRWVRR